MPVLTVQTNVPDAQITEAFLKGLSAKVAQVVGKPEQYVAVQVNGGQKLLFAGTTEPTALMELVSIGLSASQTADISKQIMTFFEENLSVKAERIYIKFTTVAGNISMIFRSIRYASTKVPPKAAAVVDDYTYCINNVRKADYENFLCTAMLKPAVLQRPGMALRALNVELSMIRDQVSNTQIGKMRLEFWKETIDSIYSSLNTTSPRKINHPVSRELDLLIRFNQLTKLWFHRLIKSREITLNDMPFHDIEQLETYLEQSITPTYYLLLELAQQRSLDADHLASHLGRAQGLINIVRSVPYNAQKRRCFIPLSYLVEHQVSQQDILNGQFSSEQFRHVIYQLCNRSVFHLQKSVELYEIHAKKHAINSSLFLPIIVVYDFLKRMKTIDFNLTDQSIQQRNPWLHWNLWRRKYPTSKELSSF